MTHEHEVDLTPTRLGTSPAGPAVAPAAVAAQAAAGAFCAHCGTAKPAGARFCPSCGKPEAGGTSGAGDRLGRISADLLEVVRSLGRDPIEGIRGSYARIDQRDSWWTAGVLIVAALLLAVIGISVGAGRLSSGLFRVQIPFFATFFSLLATPLVLAGGSYGLRRLTDHGQHTPRADLFTAAAALLPIAVAVFLSGLLGMGNVEIAFFLVFCGGILSVVMLFTGWTTICGLAPRFAAWLLPVVLAASLWAAKVILFALASF